MGMRLIDVLAGLIMLIALAWGIWAASVLIDCLGRGTRTCDMFAPLSMMNGGELIRPPHIYPTELV